MTLQLRGLKKNQIMKKIHQIVKKKWIETMTEIAYGQMLVRVNNGKGDVAVSLQQAGDNNRIRVL